MIAIISRKFWIIRHEYFFEKKHEPITGWRDVASTYKSAQFIKPTTTLINKFQVFLYSQNKVCDCLTVQPEQLSQEQRIYFVQVSAY